MLPSAVTAKLIKPPAKAQNLPLFTPAMVLRRLCPDIIGRSQRYSTMAAKQSALDFLSFVNAAPTRM
jgi:hypothetical protein